MRWTWEYLGNTRVLHDDNHAVFVPGYMCAQLRVVREADTGMPPNKNEMEDRVQQSAGRVWLFNYLDARRLRLTLSVFGDVPGAIGSEDIVRVKRVLCQWFNPQPTAPDGVLTFVGRDGIVRAINARYDDGLEYDWVYLDQGEFISDVRLICGDPLWYDPAQKSGVCTFSGTSSLQLCYELPYTLCEYEACALALTNAGDWATYPIIVVNGPAANVTVTNTTTGETIGATYSIAAGKTVTYNLTPGFKTVFDSDGNNLMSTLIQPNDLAAFHLACAYEYNTAGTIIAPGGVNNVVVNSSVAGTTATITWYDRYLSN